MDVRVIDVLFCLWPLMSSEYSSSNVMSQKNNFICFEESLKFALLTLCLFVSRVIQVESLLSPGDKRFR